MSDAGIVIGMIFLGIVFLIAIAVYYSKGWGAEKELLERREKTRAETTNVRYCANKYRREIERAKEILTLGFIAMEKGRVELKEEEVRSITLPTYMTGYQQYNIYSLLGTVLKTVTTAEEDLLYSVERANTRLADYNAYLQAPVFPRLVANARGFTEEKYDGGRLDEINRKLDESLAETKLLDGKIDNLMRETGIKSLEVERKGD
ncbi:MAG: hypothetical protein WA977_08280 [Halobacteriota archaeon]